MSVNQVGLVDKTGVLDPNLVEAAAAALNIQVIRDLAGIWDVQATVRYLPDPKNIPHGVWPVFLDSKLPAGAGGVHLDKKNQPYALIASTPDSDDWTIDASHETVEMLVDPGGNRLQTSRAIEISGDGVQDSTGQFDYLVEACDPCEANTYAYSIDGIAVSDFITPNFYDPVVTSGTRYSFGGNIKAPRQVLPGGYISFVDQQSDEMEQILLLGPKPELKKLGPATGSSLRVFVDARTNPLVAKHRKPNKALSAWCKKHREFIAAASQRKARSYDLAAKEAAR